MSWNKFIYRGFHLCKRHPLREDVSWNINITDINASRVLSSSSWGCELKYLCMMVWRVRNSHPLREDVSWNTYVVILSCDRIVILFVRMWVEIYWEVYFKRKGWVILFVRMWVEMVVNSFRYHLYASSSSWGCELKLLREGYTHTRVSHPLREDVSWNVTATTVGYGDICHPLREDVSWNLHCVSCLEHFYVILFVRMWVEMESAQQTLDQLLSSSSWGCELKWTCQTGKHIVEIVILFVRMWVEISFVAFPNL